MGDLKTFWDDSKQAFTGTSTDGAGVVSRGSDPNSDGGRDGDAGIKNFWDDNNQAMPEKSDPSTDESSNSVSGLPALPNRYEPSESINDIPDLTDRSPGTIDKQ